MLLVVGFNVGATLVFGTKGFVGALAISAIVGYVARERNRRETRVTNAYKCPRWVCSRCETPSNGIAKAEVVSGSSCAVAILVVLGLLTLFSVLLWPLALLCFAGAALAGTRSVHRNVCPQCGGDALVPIATPAGQRIVGKNVPPGIDARAGVKAPAEGGQVVGDGGDRATNDVGGSEARR
jgi:hypothetical protein